MRQVVSAVLFPIKYAILLKALELAVCCWLIEKIAGMTSKNPKYVTGSNPIGAAAAVRKTANGIIWLFSFIRKGIGRYVQKYHHVIYCHTEKLFR